MFPLMVGHMDQDEELMKLIRKYKQKSMLGVTSDDSLLFPAKLLLYSVSICY